MFSLDRTCIVCDKGVGSRAVYWRQADIRLDVVFVPLVESGICLFVDVATLSTIYDVRHPLLLPPGYPTQVDPSGLVAGARLCCLSRVPPAVCPSLLESATTVCTSFLQSLSPYVHTPTPHSILRFRPAPQTPDLHTSNLPHLVNRKHPFNT